MRRARACRRASAQRAASSVRCRALATAGARWVSHPTFYTLFSLPGSHECGQQLAPGWHHCHFTFAFGNAINLQDFKEGLGHLRVGTDLFERCAHDLGVDGVRFGKLDGLLAFGDTSWRTA